MDTFKARLAGSDLNDHVDETVVLVGEVLSHDGSTVVDMQAADGSNVRVIFDAAVSDLTKCIEVTGKVNADGTMTGWTMSNFGDNFDLKKYGEALKVMDAHRGIFQG
ncbi:hypothetical protein PTSG_06148 [Salpingoeca rosetta]|uniref:Replication factor A protein 3 n=1 Tax=Salpingoeca rosetta (strain ATCC 50818 / BSB-021) TaxID=946362 RepID=F2UC32_SALR5|nr:uncharacterized protein PTSG_06148 [Salpingoeca rosetta]EGD74139.1 hypothetical protein PTSG_06148 [Salpingoeca rosetta]|eukprot:XP_004993040.1 hypothetical protein PTSG_06148 [Salpingoeca rosetta]